MLVFLQLFMPVGIYTPAVIILSLSGLSILKPLALLLFFSLCPFFLVFFLSCGTLSSVLQVLSTGHMKHRSTGSTGLLINAVQ